MIANGIEGSRFSEIQEPQALVIGPTRELVVQIHGEARKFSYGTMVKPVVVYGGTSVGHQLRQVENGAHIVIGTPGRLLDFISKGKVRDLWEGKCTVELQCIDIPFNGMEFEFFAFCSELKNVYVTRNDTLS